MAQAQEGRRMTYCLGGSEGPGGFRVSAMLSVFRGIQAVKREF